MNLEIEGKRALVTGSNTGIGKGIARSLAADGAIVVVHGRDRNRAEKTAAQLIEAGGRAEAVAGDLATEEGAAQVIAGVKGPIDIIVNNAGGSEAVTSDWFATTDAAWERAYAVNVMSAVRMIRAFVPAMKERGWGRIINIASASATQPGRDIPEYQACKAALLNLTVSLSKALAGSGITANIVSPGPILTPGPRHWLQQLARERGDDDIGQVSTETAREQFGLSVHRWGRSEEIGAMVALLASPLSDFTTGANMRVDGGQNHGIN